MGNKNNYLTLEDSAQLLGKPTSWLKGIISRGEIGAKLSGGRWLIALRDLDKLRANLPLEPETVIHNFLSPPSTKEQQATPKRKERSGPLRQPHREPNSITRANTREGTLNAGGTIDTGEELVSLDAKVKYLTVNIEARLSFVPGGKAIWNKLRRDNYGLHEARKAGLSKKTLQLLDDLRCTKQRYILLRETDRYKWLLGSLPEWDPVRIAKKIEAARTKRSKSVKVAPKPAQIGGIDGYFTGRWLAEKRYWFNEED